MLLNIKVIPKAKKRRIVKIDGLWKVYVNSPADKGRANKEVIEFLSKELQVPKSNITIIRGLSSRDKVIEIA